MQKGSKHSETTKEKIRKSLIGNQLSDETKQRIKQALTGKPHKKHKPMPSEARKRAAETRSKEYMIFLPNGNAEFVRNLEAFCRYHRLSRTKLRRMLKGEISHYNGLTGRRL